MLVSLEANWLQVAGCRREYDSRSSIGAGRFLSYLEPAVCLVSMDGRRPCHVYFSTAYLLAPWDGHKDRGVSMCPAASPSP